MRDDTYKNLNSFFIEIIGTQPIAFNPILGKMANSATAGLFMSQLLYWTNKGRDRDWFYKTITDTQLETCLTRSEQSRAIKIWKGMGVLETKNRGIPRRRHFHVNAEKLLKLMREYANKYAESNIQDGKKRLTTTEITSEIISKITPERILATAKRKLPIKPIPEFQDIFFI